MTTVAMGNQLALQAPLERGTAESLLAAELGARYTCKEALGGGRFLKTLQCVGNAGAAVAKVYARRQNDAEGIGRFVERLRRVKEKLEGSPGAGSTIHCWPYQEIVQTDRAVYLVRPYGFCSVRDRLSTRPFLSAAERAWIAFQMMCALAEAHGRGVAHGDVKLENALVTSWHWVFLSDFAPFKPAMLPADNPADFSFFFDAGGRRRCYLAPERFTDGSSAADFDVPLQFSSDVFSLGCCIAELYTEGTALFDLGALLRYRTGAEDRREEALQGVSAHYPEVARMVLHMTQRDPARRLSAQEYVAIWAPKCFPRFFKERLHGFMGDMLLCDCNRRVEMVQQALPELERAFAAESAALNARIGGGSQGNFEASDAGSDLISDVARLDISRLLPDGADGRGHDAHDAGTDGADADGMDAWADPAALDGAGGVQGGQSPSASLCASIGTAGCVEKEEVWEYQSRSDDTRAWVEVDPVGADVGASDGAGHDAPCMIAAPAQAPASWRRQMRQLPSGGGWRWLDDGWTAEKWQYMIQEEASSGTYSEAHAGHTPAFVGVGQTDAALAEDAANAARERRWRETESPVATSRRRRWVRRRRRVMAVGGSGSGDMATAVASGAPQATVAQVAAQGDDGSRGVATNPCIGAAILAAALCSAARGAARASCRRAALQMLARLSPALDDDTRLQRIMPYVLSLVPDPSSAVRSKAVEVLADVAMLVRAFPPSEAKAFPEYVLPALSLLPADPEAGVRATYAVHLARIASAADTFLARAQLNASQEENQSAGSGARGGTGDGSGGGSSAIGATGGGAAGIRFDEERAALRIEVEQALQELATPTDSHSSNRASSAAVDVAAVRRAVLRSAHALCGALGRRECAGFLLPMLITFLNDRDWQLRAAFFDEAAAIGAAAGGAAVEQFLLPCVENTLCDPEEAVAAAALRCLAKMISSPAAPLRRPATLAAVKKAAPLLVHPSAAVASAARAAVAAAAAAVGAADKQTFILPALLPVLKYPALDMTSERALLDASKPPVTCEQLEALVQVAIAQSRGVDASGGMHQIPGQQVLAGLDPDVRSALAEHATRRANRMQGGGSKAASAAAAAASSRAAAAAAAPPPLAALGLLPVEPTREGRGVAGSAAARYHLDHPPPLGADADDGAGHGGASGAVGEGTDRVLPDSDRHARTVYGAPPASLAPDARGGANVEKASLQANLAASPALTLNPGAIRRLPGGTAATPAGLSSPSTSMHRHTSARSIHAHHAAHAHTSSQPAPRLMPVAPVLSPSGSGPAGWRPRGVLLAHLAEHSGAVTGIACSHDGAFFATGSADGTIKVWDKRRVEKDVSFRSRLTYNVRSDSALGGRSPAGVTKVCALPDHRVAASVSDGSVHIFSVSYNPAVRGQGIAEQYAGSVERIVDTSVDEGAALSVAATPPGSVAAAGGAGQLILWSTQWGRVHALGTCAPCSACSHASLRAGEGAEA